MKNVLCFLIILTCVSICCLAEPVGDLEARFSEETDIIYEGTTFRLRKRLTPILIAGTDTRVGDAPPENEYRNGGQADFLMVLVVDDNRDTVQPVLINRDTMTEITVLNIMGDVSGTRTAQICLAHGFGDGYEQSCELLSDAVSGLLLDVPIDHYAVVNLDGISVFNDMIGGIEITLEDDFSIYDPAMTAGTTLVLRGMQAEYYVRERYYVGEQSNESRMERQQIYMSAASHKFAECLTEDKSFATELLNAMESMLVTDMGSGEIINIASRAAEYEILPVITLKGNSELSNSGYMEFYADPEALRQTVLEVFYEPVN